MFECWRYGGDCIFVYGGNGVGLIVKCVDGVFFVGWNCFMVGYWEISVVNIDVDGEFLVCFLVKVSLLLVNEVDVCCYFLDCVEE